MSKFPTYFKSHSYLQPLRIPAGWRVTWNTLNTMETRENGDLGGSSLFLAVHDDRRFYVDVEFRPEFDPQGEFHLIISYQPWPRNEKGRRIEPAPVRMDDKTEEVFRHSTPSYDDLVVALEEWLWRCADWQRERN